MSLILETTLGDLEIDLYVERCPTLCYNFIKLCKIKYYNLILFHSVQKNFVAQTGDPSGLGNGGSSIFGIVNGPERRYFKKITTNTGLKHIRPGLLSMVNCGDDMFGSQFFITLGSNLHSLDGEHLVFGEVIDGTDVLAKFNELITDNAHRPYKDVRVTHTVIIYDPFEDPNHMLVPSRSPSPNSEVLRNSRLDSDQIASSDEVLSETEKVERLRSKDALAQATILEMIGDLPSYDVAPPENVLFVCHLNPATTDEDLEIIFSRFGTMRRAQVIRDKRSGDSLQYAFIEFEDKKACEEAYMKMEGVLIDERRIHVDFGQSVAKYIQRIERDRDDQKKGRSIRKATAHDSGRDKPKGDMKYDEQQSGKGFHRKKLSGDEGRHSTSRKHDSRRRKPFACNENPHPRRDGSCTYKEQWQQHSKGREEKHRRKQSGSYYQCARDKTEWRSTRYACRKEGHRRHHRNRERSYDDESRTKERRRVSTDKKQ